MDSIIFINLRKIRYEKITKKYPFGYVRLRSERFMFEKKRDIKRAKKKGDMKEAKKKKKDRNKIEEEEEEKDIRKGNEGRIDIDG
ncbi:hypothetical protein Phum_PHUM265240 [Pediculus humanus corporis]|uniref:Uncharacterized protein n=1 Tax=Pediculus humanus subsp. corporis TaxID=121224 RepID=E0VKI6_PEDHC|nr:uncharacterized protein Phum_PHUM265240 [Pediculus humanus corporis]EEB13892.1 hypothetical protein Phum_PHUM265240 [Pediculus humanus corporis]